jgi:peptide/nickel transport system substrate-binding protein
MRDPIENKLWLRKMAAGALGISRLWTVAAALLSAAVPADIAHADESGPSLAMSISSDIRSTNPGVNRDSNTDVVLMHVVEGLVASREDGSPGPLLASRIETSADGRIYRFFLRHGVRFHNGASLTSADVLWSWQRYLDPKTGWLCLPQFDGSHGARIVSITAPSQDEVVFQLDRPQPMLLAQMATVTCGGTPILHSSSLNPDGSWRTAISTGPYRLSSIEPGDYVELSAFEEYAARSEPRDGYTGAKIAYAPRIRFIVIRDAAARIAALMKGQIDVMSELTTADIHRLQHAPSVRIASAPGGTVNAILIQGRDPLLADVRIRQALQLSIDRRSVTLLCTAGTGQLNASMVPVSSPYYDTTQATRTPVDIPLARRLLAQAGYKGQPITITTNRRFTDMFDQALLVQAMARKAGIDIRLDVTEWASQVNRYQTGNYQLMSFNYSARPDPFFNYEAMLGERGVSERKVWNDPAAIQLLDAVGVQSEPRTRQTSFNQLHLSMLEAVPLIVLFNPADANGVRADLAGFQAWSLGRARLWGVRKTGQRAR